MSDEPLFMHDEYWSRISEAGFLYPQWDDISSIIDDTRGGEERIAAWHEARDRWVAHTCEAFNAHPGMKALPRKRYHTGRSEQFAVVAPTAEDIAAELASLGEKFRTLARRVLGERITADPIMGYVVLIPHYLQAAQDYLRPFGINAGAIKGVFLGGAGPHIVIRDMTHFELRLTYIHELNHAVLHNLPIPDWIHEGLSRYFESRVLSISNMYYTAERDPARNRFWRENGIKDFWSGAVFRDQRAYAGYPLAHKMILRLLKRDEELFTQFMLQANSRDAGDAACRCVYGSGLLDMMSDLLGAGEWADPASINKVPERPA